MSFLLTKRGGVVVTALFGLLAIVLGLGILLTGIGQVNSAQAEYSVEADPVEPNAEFSSLSMHAQNVTLEAYRISRNPSPPNSITVPQDQLPTEYSNYGNSLNRAYLFEYYLVAYNGTLLFVNVDDHNETSHSLTVTSCLSDGAYRYDTTCNEMYTMPELPETIQTAARNALNASDSKALIYGDLPAGFTTQSDTPGVGDGTYLLKYQDRVYYLHITSQHAFLLLASGFVYSAIGIGLILIGLLLQHPRVRQRFPLSF